MDIVGTDFEIKEVPIERWKNVETFWVIRRKVFGLWWETLNQYSEFESSSWPDQYAATRYLIAYLGERKFKRKIEQGRIKIVRHEPYPDGNRILEFSDGYRLMTGFYNTEGLSIVYVAERDLLETEFKTVTELIMKAELAGHRIDNKIDFAKNCGEKDPYPGCIPITLNFC
jgi:hypothetical protein